MLDDGNVIKQRDSQDALGVAACLYQQVSYQPELLECDHDDREMYNIVVMGMGGSALAADMVRVLLRDSLPVPLEVVKTYDLPRYVGKNTLLIVSSHSGNTEESLACINQALTLKQQPQIAVITTGGELQNIANEHNIMHVLMPADTQPRMAVTYNLKSILAILAAFGFNTQALIAEISASAGWLQNESELWLKTVPTRQNYAKQLALIAVGKTPVFYAGPLMAPVAYKWKISWNENAKNVAFNGMYPEFNHNEFIGWTSHPIEKPFAVFDLWSDLEHPQVQKRFRLSDKLLSGKRPKANIVQMQGETLVQQMLWGCILADFVSIYVAVLNGVNPTKVELIEKLKRELAA